MKIFQSTTDALLWARQENLHLEAATPTALKTKEAAINLAHKLKLENNSNIAIVSDDYKSHLVLIATPQLPNAT